MDGTLNTTGTDGTRIVFWHRELPPQARVAAGTARAARKLQDELSFHWIAVEVLQTGGQNDLCKAWKRRLR